MPNKANYYRDLADTRGHQIARLERHVRLLKHRLAKKHRDSRLSREEHERIRERRAARAKDADLRKTRSELVALQRRIVLKGKDYVKDSPHLALYYFGANDALNKILFVGDEEFDLSLERGFTGDHPYAECLRSLRRFVIQREYRDYLQGFALGAVVIFLACLFIFGRS